MACLFGGNRGLPVSLFWRVNFVLSRFLQDNQLNGKAIVMSICRTTRSSASIKLISMRSYQRLSFLSQCLGRCEWLVRAFGKDWYNFKQFWVLPTFPLTGDLSWMSCWSVWGLPSLVSYFWSDFSKLDITVGSATFSWFCDQSNVTCIFGRNHVCFVGYRAIPYAQVQGLQQQTQLYAIRLKVQLQRNGPQHGRGQHLPGLQGFQTYLEPLHLPLHVPLNITLQVQSPSFSKIDDESLWESFKGQTHDSLTNLTTQ